MHPGFPWFARGPLSGPFLEGPFSTTWRGARKLPISVNGAFPLLNGPFSDLNGPFPENALMGRFPSWKSPGRQHIKKRGIKRFSVLVISIVSVISADPALNLLSVAVCVVFVGFRDPEFSREGHPVANYGLCVRSPALNLSKNCCVFFPFFDHSFGRRTVPKLMNNRPKSAQWRLAQYGFGKL